MGALFFFLREFYGILWNLGILFKYVLPAPFYSRGKN